MSNLIWADMEAYRGIGKGENDTETTFIPGPENKRECPCDTCPMNTMCLENATECSAMRNWCSKGDFQDKELQRLVRACA